MPVVSRRKEARSLLVGTYFDHAIVLLVGVIQVMDIFVEVAELSCCGVQYWAGTYFHFKSIIIVTCDVSIIRSEVREDRPTIGELTTDHQLAGWRNLSEKE